MAWPTDWVTGEVITAARLKQWTDALRAFGTPGDTSASLAELILTNSSKSGKVDVFGTKIRIGERNASDIITVDLATLKVGIGIGATSPTISGTGVFQHAGDTIRLVDLARTPASSAAAGNAGEFCIDTGFIYIHSGGSWRRVAVATF